jgi:hypothetical protein
MKAWIASAAVVAALTTGAAQAGDVSWSVTVSSPRTAPQVIYTPPPVIYQPVYQPVVYAQPVYRIPPGHMKKGHKHGYKYGYAQGYRHGRHDD